MQQRYGAKEQMQWVAELKEQGILVWEKQTDLKVETIYQKSRYHSIILNTTYGTSTIKARSDRKEEQGRIARATSATYLVSPGNQKEPDSMYDKYD